MRYGHCAIILPYYNKLVHACDCVCAQPDIPFFRLLNVLHVLSLAVSAGLLGLADRALHCTDDCDSCVQEYDSLS